MKNSPTQPAAYPGTPPPTNGFSPRLIVAACGILFCATPVAASAGYTSISQGADYASYNTVGSTHNVCDQETDSNAVYSRYYKVSGGTQYELRNTSGAISCVSSVITPMYKYKVCEDQAFNPDECSLYRLA